MPINPTTLKALIDTQITNETVDFAITPAEVGGRMKDTVDYTTEQIALKEDTANKQTDLTASATKFPTVNAVNTGLALKEDLTNKSTNVTTDGASDIKYPSVKAVKTYTDNATLTTTKVLKTTITSAQILNLFSTPITILPASVDSGIYRQLVNVIVARSGAGTAYSVAAQLVVSLGNASAYPIQQLSNFVLSDTTWSSFAVPDTNYIFKNDLVTYPNVYKIQALSSNPTGGTGDVDVYVTYIEITL
jgi:hypothetical protein